MVLEVLADKPTYTSKTSGGSSCVDHFLVSSNVFDNLVSCSVDDNPANPSDHQEFELVLIMTL